MTTKCYVIVLEYHRPTKTINYFRYLTHWSHIHEQYQWNGSNSKHIEIEFFLPKIFEKIDPKIRFKDSNDTAINHPFLFLNKNYAENVISIIKSHNTNEYPLFYHIVPIEIENLKEFADFFYNKIEAPITLLKASF